MLNKIIYTILGISIALVFFPHPSKDSSRNRIVSGTSTQRVEDALTPTPEMAVNLSAPILTAKAALAYDYNSGAILYSRNLDEKLPIASLTKLMTALAVMENQNLNAVVEIEKQDVGVVGSSIGLAAGEKITVDSLLHAMLIASSNDAAVALANFVAGSDDKFAELMNKQAEVYGLVSTHFSNAVGWDIGDNYSNTLDLIKIVKEFLKNSELRQIVQTKQMTISSIDGKYIHELTTTNKFLLDNPEVVGIKTGFTSQAKGNLIILINHYGRQIITIVLDSDDREADTQKLLDWLFTVYKW